MNSLKDIPDFNSKKSILIIRLSSLGDILLTTPLLRSIKNQYPALKISFVVRTQYQDSLKLNPHISELFLYEPQKDKFSKLVSELKRNRYDLVIDLQNNLRSKEINRFS